jgi:hypothetical protein
MLRDARRRGGWQAHTVCARVGKADWAGTTQREGVYNNGDTGMRARTHTQREGQALLSLVARWPAGAPPARRGRAAGQCQRPSRPAARTPLWHPQLRPGPHRRAVHLSDLGGSDGNVGTARKEQLGHRGVASVRCQHQRRPVVPIERVRRHLTLQQPARQLLSDWPNALSAWRAGHTHAHTHAHTHTHTYIHTYIHTCT